MKLTLKRFEKGKMVFHYTTDKKNRFWYRFVRAAFPEGYIKIVYQKGVFNDAYFNSFQDGRELISMFTQKSLVDYLSQGEFRE